MNLSRASRRSTVVILALLLGAVLASARPAAANPTLVVDVDSGAVLYNDKAGAPWYPASLTKLMTTYVALSKVREGKIAMDTPLRVSMRAARMAPSKMGFRPGTLVTLDNALKMLMVKSPNDVAVTIAEGLSGSVEAFADEMNAYAAKLGLHESHFVNPNGLPDPNHVSSARDMATIGRALLREFPEQHDLFGIPALSFGGRIISNHNGLLGRYPGVDGMKTGFTCSAGYNVVASARRGDRRLIVVVMGAPTARERSQRAAALFERYFAAPETPTGDLATLPASDSVSPPDLRAQICGPGRANAILEAEADDLGLAPQAPAEQPLGTTGRRDAIFGLAMGQTPPAGPPAPSPVGPVELLHPRDPFVPVPVFIGPAPGWTGPVVGPIEASAPGPKGRKTLARAGAGQAAPADAAGLAPSAASPSGAGGVTPLGAAVPGAVATGSSASGTAPMALAGAVATPPALAAAEKIVPHRGRLGMRVGRKAAGKGPAKPIAAKAKKPIKKPGVAAR